MIINRKQAFTIFCLVCRLLFFSTVSYGCGIGALGGAIDPFELKVEPLKSEAEFVTVPSYIGRYTGIAVGTVLTLPVGILAGIPFGIYGTVKQKSAWPILAGPVLGAAGALVIGGGLVGYVGEAVVGTPFYIIKKCFYDLPVHGVKSIAVKSE